MGVKDLIGLFDSSPMSAGSSSSTSSLPRDQPPPSRARFINHPHRRNSLLREGHSADIPLVSHPLLATPSPAKTKANEELTILTTNVTESNLKRHDNVMSTISPITPVPAKRLYQPHKHHKHKKIYPDDPEEHRDLLPKVPHGYPPSVPTLTSNEEPLSSTATLVNQYPAANHTPVPATTIFARNSAPLYLPKLDKYLEGLDRPSFTPSGKGKLPVMFPPMDRLSALGRTIEELEANVFAPNWRTRGNIFGAFTSAFVGLTGSSAIATYYSLQGLFNTVQIFALILNTIVPVDGFKVEGNWRQLFMGTIPNVLALNFASTLTESLIFLIILISIASLLLFYFYWAARNSERYQIVEAFQSPVPKGSQWGLLLASFLLTVIYLPLSTLAVHVLVWSQDLWVVPNPYINATSYPPDVPPLGPPDEFRDPLDFCWTTTMKLDQINFAPIVVIMSAAIFVALTIYFPVRLHQIIKTSVPRVDPYTELGRLRSQSDMDREYARLLDRDHNPFSFLYRDFRRNWGTYQPVHLVAKLCALLIIAVIDSNNCVFRSLPRLPLAVTRQTILLISTVVFFALQCYRTPFIDPASNADEWISRVNYMAAAAIALAVALEVPNQNIIDGPVLYTIYGITYGLSFYFIVIDVKFMQRVVKRLSRRIDFSIDIFSPRLDLSLHTRRRVWQEPITTLLLTDPDCGIPRRQRMVYAQSRDSKYPPYLLNFLGTPGERHVENLKILREVGSAAYKRAVELVCGPDHALFKCLEDEILQQFIGPDCYWRNTGTPSVPGRTKFFGNAWWIPFPPTLVIQYDDGPLAVLRELSEFEEYISQNSSDDVRRRRYIRMSLRALEGQVVVWPYDHIEPVGSYSPWCCGRRRYMADTAVHYQLCVLQIKRRGHLIWKESQFGSGFDVELVYGRKIRPDGGIIGLTDDYELTRPLARFLLINQDRIYERLETIDADLASYRSHCRKECRSKRRVLTYRFLSLVYDLPQEPNGLTDSSIAVERDSRVRHLMTCNTSVFVATYERFKAVSMSKATQWWYIFWDDLWRRNYDTISALQLHASDFNPYYPTSVAYTPLPRPVLETFLIERGLLSRVPKSGDFFHTGFLNKLYIRLNEAVYGGSDQAILFHIGNDVSELDMENVDLRTEARTSTIGTGGGTDYDNTEIQARPTYKWEGLLTDPLRSGKLWRRRWFAKMGAWFGITPLWKSEMLSKGLAVDVRLENGRYVVMEKDV